MELVLLALDLPSQSYGNYINSQSRPGRGPRPFFRSTSSPCTGVSLTLLGVLLTASISYWFPDQLIVGKNVDGERELLHPGEMEAI